MVSNFLPVGISWVRNFFSWVFCGSKSFSRGYYVDLEFLLMCILWVQSFFSGVITRSKNFYRVYFVGNSWIYNQAKVNQDPEAELWSFKNYFLSSSALSSKNNLYILKCAKKQVRSFQQDHMTNIMDTKNENKK